MSIKDLFDKQRTEKILSAHSLDDLASESESCLYLDASIKDKNRFIPAVDFSDPANFARYGLAEEYYSSSISHIYSNYPYDGSKYEKQAWHNSASYIENYIFDNEYPRRNGYITLAADQSGNGWGTLVNTVGEYGAPATSSYEYVLFYGGPNASTRGRGKDVQDASGDFKSGYANIWDTSKGRESNLRFGGTNGNAVEFWLKKGSFNTTNTKKEAILDIYTISSASGSSDYGRLTIELSGHGAGTSTLSPFYVTHMSGGVGYATASIGSSITTSTVADDQWHHYAFVFATSSATAAKMSLYIDGKHNHTVLPNPLPSSPSTTVISEVSGALKATLGSLVFAPSGSGADASEAQTVGIGWGKLSGSLDEFRFWKKSRTSQEIGRNWFTQVGAGANSDDPNSYLSTYYKFNEGTTELSHIDSIILDYSGRINNGSWVGYTPGIGSRASGSAMVSASAADSEFKDPIVFSKNPDVENYFQEKTNLGFSYDTMNNSALHYSMPEWIATEDKEQSGHLKHLTQIISNYFDSLHLQIEAISKIKDLYYATSGSITGSVKPVPFARNLLISSGLEAPELFVDSSIIEQLMHRTEKKEFVNKLHDIKNLIYQNLYYNIVNIYKSKGTEKAIRNLTRCFGIDEKIIKLNIYADNITYDFKDNHKADAIRRKYINFNDPDAFGATIYQSTSSATDSAAYISGSNVSIAAEYLEGSSSLGMTAEAEVFFPKKWKVADSEYFTTNFLTSSLFGSHTPDVARATTGDTSWASVDTGSFQIYALRKEIDSDHVKFMLTSSMSDDGYIPTLTSSLFYDVYDNNKWNLSLSLKPSTELSDVVTGSYRSDWLLEFYGVNVLTDVVRDEFLLTASMSSDQARKFLSSPKRLYVGAHRVNFTGSLYKESDIKIGSLKYWNSYLDKDTIKAHAMDVENIGIPDPYKNAYGRTLSLTGSNVFVPAAELLALNWEFGSVTGSGGGLSGLSTVNDAGFSVNDLTSGSATLNNRYGWLGGIIKNNHPGVANFFLPNKADMVTIEYINCAKKQLPESLDSSDMVNILANDDVYFERDSRPINHFFAIEKSMYRTVSEEMIKMFSSIKDFNNLIGEPVNRYRHEYKDLNKLRHLFFERIENTPNLEKYLEYYKWIDSSISKVLQQFMPASARVSDVSNIIESHVLERNKYQHKFPTLEMKTPEPEAHVKGVNELNYSWKYGHAPLPGQKASAADALKITGGTVWHNDAFTVLVPENAGGYAGDITITVLARTSMGSTPSANQIHWYLDPASDAAKIANLKLVFNGTTDTAKVKFGSSFTDTIGVKGLTASDGVTTTDSYASLTADVAGLNGNNIALTDTVGTVLVNESALTSGKLVGGREPGENDNCLWWKERAERDGVLASGDASLDSSKVSILRTLTTDISGTGPTLAAGGSTYEGSAYALRRSSKPYKINLNLVKDIRGGVNFDRNKKVNNYRSLINNKIPSITNVTKNIAFVEGKVYDNDKCDDDSALNTKPKHYFKVTDKIGSTSIATLDGDATVPFSIVSSSVDSKSSFLKETTTGRTFTNIHHDAYEGEYETPIQGPFTEKYVGGNQHRHIGVNVGDDDKTNRPEAWKLLDTAGSNELYIYSQDSDKPRAAHYRDEIAKRPVNIKNIRQHTGQGSPSTALDPENWRLPHEASSLEQVINKTNIGNYSHFYEIVQSSGGRSNQNRWLIKNGTGAFDLQASTDVSMVISGTFNFKLPDRTISYNTYAGAVTSSASNDWVITSRFSAPGGPEVMARGSLDIIAEEYAVYNALPWRNTAVRGPLDLWYTNHTKQGGFYSDAQNSASWDLAIRYGNRAVGDYPGTSGSISANSFEGSPSTASYHTVHRNTKLQPFLRDSDTTTYTNAKLLSFNGTSHNVNIGTAATWDDIIGDGSNSNKRYTLSAWIYATDLDHAGGGDYPRIFDFGLQDIALLIRSNGIIQVTNKFTDTDGEWVTSGSAVDLNKWIHVAVTYDARSVNNDPKIYIDGALVDIVENSAPAGNHYGIVSQACYIGDTSAGDRNFEGYMDEPNIWNTDLTADQIKEIYKGSRNEVYREGPGELSTHSAVSNLVSWWRTDGDSSTTLTDNYGSNNGTLVASGMIITNNGATVALLPPVITYNISTKKQYDNWFVQHQIPRSDMQYAWITASVNTNYTGSAWYGFEEPDWSNAGLASTTLTFVSASEFGSYGDDTQFIWWGNTHTLAGSGAFTPTDFAGINWNVYEPISTETNTVGYGANTRMVSLNISQNSYINPDFYNPSHPHGIPENFTSGSEALNALMLHRGGAYGYPSWKQIRTGAHPVARKLREKNIISVLDVPVEKTVIDSKGGITIAKTRRGETFTQYVEPPITSKFKPLLHVFRTKEDVTSRYTKPISMTYTYSNNMCAFANSELNVKLQTLKRDKDADHIYEDTVALYTAGRLSAVDNPIDEFAALYYKEVVYPKGTNMFLKRTRERLNFNFLWRNKRADRAIASGSIDIFGHVIPATSKWPLDARTDFTTQESTASLGAGEGILQNNYCIFYGSPHAKPIPAPVYARRRLEKAHPTNVMHPYGDVLYEISSSRQPFYDSYEDYAQDLRLKGKDYAVIPEFRISKHMPYYVNEKGGNFYADNPGFLSIETSANDYTAAGVFVPPTTKLVNDDALNSSARIEREDFVEGTLNTQKWSTGRSEWSPSVTGVKPNLIDGGYGFVFGTNVDGEQEPRILQYEKTLKGITNVSFRFIKAANEGGGTPWFSALVNEPEATENLLVQYAVLSGSTIEGEALIAPEYNSSDWETAGTIFASERTSGKWYDYSTTINTTGSYRIRIIQETYSDGAYDQWAIDNVGIDSGEHKFNSKFFKEYAHSDFMKYFDLMKADHSEVADPTRITLTCKALMKFIPYDGFYPVQRTVQLAQLFSQSYGPAVVYTGTGANFRTVMQPWFTPGILYNTIKSSVACDWPAYNLAGTDDMKLVVETGYGHDDSDQASLVDAIDCAGIAEGDAFTMTVPTAAGGDGVAHQFVFDNTTDINNLSDTNGFGISLTVASTDILAARALEDVINGVQNAAVQYGGGTINMSRTANVPAHGLRAAVGTGTTKTTLIMTRIGTTGEVSSVLAANTGFESALLLESAFDIGDINLGLNETVLDLDSSTGNSFDYRLPFESILKPSQQSEGGNFKYRDLEPETVNVKSNISSSFVWAQTKTPNPLYSLAMHNFLAEVPNFFLKNKSFTSFSSLPDGNAELLNGLEPGMTYGMYVGLANQENWLANMATPKPSTFTTYTRASAFGPPSTGTPTSTVTRPYYGPFLPVVHPGLDDIETSLIPGGSHFYDSGSLALSSSVGLCLMKWQPGANRNYTIKEILEEIQISGSANAVSFVRLGEEDYVEKSTDLMHISASVNLFDLAEVPGSVEYDADRTPLTIRSDTTKVNKWTIQMKFETPSLNFINSYVTAPQVGSGSVAKGMWHQMGEYDEQEGYWLSIDDTLWNKNTNASYRSLAKILGFETGAKRIGKVEQSKIVSEAVVAIPFIDRGGKREFFDIDKSSFANARRIVKKLPLREAAGTSPSIFKIAHAMDKYVFPPQMDFFKNEKIDPFAMYVFEFQHKFSQNDLLNIWQNVMPDVGTSFKESWAYQSHPLLASEIMKEIPNNLRWLVFKVKQEAEKNYFKMTADSSDDTGFRFNIEQNEGDVVKGWSPEYSYNWPYDYFSLVELVQLESSALIGKYGAMKKIQEKPLKPPVLTDESLLSPSSLVPPTLQADMVTQAVTEAVTSAGGIGGPGGTPINPPGGGFGSEEGDF